ncbi:MAG: hypothetical protein M1837_001349 [Sclerophora amabilis]|nr:MAG: hypothetical protein M1837_001349 [Sclerophora amabilis]
MAPIPPRPESRSGPKYKKRQSHPLNAPSTDSVESPSLKKFNASPMLTQRPLPSIPKTNSQIRPSTSSKVSSPQVDSTSVPAVSSHESETLANEAQDFNAPASVSSSKPPVGPFKSTKEPGINMKESVHREDPSKTSQSGPTFDPKARPSSTISTTPAASPRLQPTPSFTFGQPSLHKSSVSFSRPNPPVEGPSSSSVFGDSSTTSKPESSSLFGSFSKTSKPDSSSLSNASSVPSKSISSSKFGAPSPPAKPKSPFSFVAPSALSKPSSSSFFGGSGAPTAPSPIVQAPGGLFGAVPSTVAPQEGAFMNSGAQQHAASVFKGGLFGDRPSFSGSGWGSFGSATNSGRPPMGSPFSESQLTAPAQATTSSGLFGGNQPYRSQGARAGYNPATSLFPSHFPPANPHQSNTTGPLGQHSHFLPRADWKYPLQTTTGSTAPPQASDRISALEDLINARPLSSSREEQSIFPRPITGSSSVKIPYRDTPMQTYTNPPTQPPLFSLGSPLSPRAGTPIPDPPPKTNPIATDEVRLMIHQLEQDLTTTIATLRQTQTRIDAISQTINVHRIFLMLTIGLWLASLWVVLGGDLVQVGKGRR